jgi:hypothetical protein
VGGQEGDRRGRGCSAGRYRPADQTLKNVRDASGTAVLTPLVVSVNTMLVKVTRSEHASLTWWAGEVGARSGPGEACDDPIVLRSGGGALYAQEQPTKSVGPHETEPPPKPGRFNVQ